MGREKKNMADEEQPLLQNSERADGESFGGRHKLEDAKSDESGQSSSGSGRKEDPMDGEVEVESLDYDPIHSWVFARKTKTQQRRRIYGYTGLTFAKWSITIAIGLVVGTVAYIIESSQELLVNYKKMQTQVMIDSGQGLWVAFVGYMLFGLLLVVISSCLVLYWSPAAAGGGVTMVMAYLNGNEVPDFLRLSTLFTKFFGTICTVSSGLPIGQEGPMVHMGAAIASALTWMQGQFPAKRMDDAEEDNSRRYFWKWRLKAFVFDFHSDKDRREFISAGTAAGIAAAFGAPIGGVLFSLEEASSFWSKKVMWRSLLCTAVATVVLSWLHERQFSLVLPGNIAFHGLQPSFVLGDLPLFIVTSAGAGVLGSFVNICHGWLAQLRPASGKKTLRLLEACSVTIIAVGSIFLLPLLFGQCKPRPDVESEEGIWFRYTCRHDEGEDGEMYYNDLATLLFSVPHQTIQSLLELGSEAETYFSMTSLALHCVSFLILFILSYGIATPGGIFMPSIMVGASFGALTGCVFAVLFPSIDVQPGLHALIGATAMLGGVFRSSISVVVIVVEGTGGIDFLLPIILAIVVANWVAHYFHNAGAYEADLERLGDISFLQSEPPRALIPVTAEEIMNRDIVSFPEIPTVQSVLEKLRATKHNGFPVLRYSLDGTIGPEDGLLVGMILRHQLLLLLEEQAFVEVDESIALHHQLPHRHPVEFESRSSEFLENAMRVYHHYHNPHRRFLTSAPEHVDQLNVQQLIDEFQRSQYEDSDSPKGGPKMTLGLDLRPFMNRAPITVRKECSAQRVFVIFRTLGLRHLCVTDSTNRVIGMITRKDIAKVQHEAPQRGVFQPSLSDAEGKASHKEMYYYLP